MFPDLTGVAKLCPKRGAATDRTQRTAALDALTAGGP
jgi:hypothetical protein